MANKLIIVGVGAVVVIAVIVVLAFAQNQADKAEQIKVQKIAETLNAKQNVLDTCSITSQIIGTNQKNMTEYTECVNKYYARAGEPLNETEKASLYKAIKICRVDNWFNNYSKYYACIKANDPYAQD
jgi:hypothetical protein